MIANQISLSRSPMRRSIARFAALRQWDKVYDLDTVILSLVVLTAVMFVIAVLIYGTAAVAEKLLPFLWLAAYIAMVFCIVVLLPLSLFRRTRIVPACGFVIASHLFGLGMWMYGFLVTYDLWGGTGIFVGLLLGGIGVVPLAIIAAALKQMWTVVKASW
jgi:hypothetical protein